MEYYEYKSRNRINGKVFKGIITAEDIESAEDNLKKRGEDILEISIMQDFLGIRKTIHNIATRTNKKTKLEFFSMLRFMLESGMSLYESLINIRDSSIDQLLKNLARIIADEVRQGADLSTAMRKSGQFDIAMVQQINSGEESGNIDDTLVRLTEQIEREIEFKGKIKSAMMYPIIICVVMVVVLWVMMTLVVPSLAETLVSMGGELPLITKIVIGASDLMAASTPYLILGIILLVIGYKAAVMNKDFKLKVDGLKLKIPIVGNMIEKIELSKFCRNLSAMQKSGIALVGSLKTVQTAIKNSEISKAVEKASRLVEISGMNLSNALAKAGSFPAMMLQLIEVGINSGQICEVLDKIAMQYEKEVNVGLKRVTSLIEPIMIVVVGLLAGTVVISIFLPMFSMTDSLEV
ncbi:MAG: type II secretion system F family protein [Lachnospiraceae bacterium]|nr:type II secretion system F family protein [Lachnospiraceae bacterium]